MRINVNWIATAVALLAAAKSAQPQPLTPAEIPPTEAPIEEIQVTATRRPVGAADVSAALSLIPGESVRIRKLTTDALAAEPGVFLQQTTPGQGAAIVRGLKGSEVLHLVDGMRLNNAIFRNAPTQYLALVSPATVDRIEVLRGSQASLYGSDAVGGVVQVINRVPAFDSASLSHRGELAVGLDTAELERSLRASLDVGNESLAALFSLDSLQTGNRRTGAGLRVGPSGYRSTSGRAAVAYTPDSTSGWYIDLQYGEQPNTPRFDELVAGFGQTEPSSSEFAFAPNARRFVHVRHTRDQGWLRANWQIDLAWQRIDDDRVTRDFAATERLLEANASDLLGLTLTAAGESALGSWVGGVEFYVDEVSSRRRSEALVSGQSVAVQARFPDGSEVVQAALFGNLRTALTDTQTLSSGLRFSAVDVSLAATVAAPAANLDFDDFSADLGWNWALTDALSLTANAGYGFRAPNVFDLGTLGVRPGNRFNVPNVNLRSEKVGQFDAGARFQGSRISTEFVAWVLRYSDRLTSVLTGELTTDGRDIVQTQNRARALLWGVESAGRITISDRVAARWVLNLTRGEQEEANGETEPADRIPPLNGRLGLEMALRDGLRLDTYLQFAAGQDRLSPRDRRDPRIDPTGTDGWTTANVDLRWQTDERWLLQLSALNLLDRGYRLHGSGIDAPGRNLALHLRYFW